ncbi:aminotransferase class I/II-fold pyridoxal phosphate-dependent enzyme [Oleidesulfovibrio sp.]|uniref:aminotransferase class I/II-fold pyridoxal phosphate-dependent enzyme n=1 Tax=Oleidesulfovibrio sp. TaxID=2909707 RepID=UPI003A83CE5F
MVAASLDARIKAIRNAGLYRSRPVPEKRDGKWIELDGIRMLNLASNDYLGLATDAEWQKKVAACFALHPPSASASPLAGGHSRAIQQAEEALAEYFGYAECLLLPSGYQANLAVLWGLSTDQTTVFYDKRIHASSAAGLRGTPASPCGFNHNNIAHLRRRLDAMPASDLAGRDALVLVESLYSMDGDSPDFAALSALKAEYNFTLAADEAHAFGVLGKGGRGLAAGHADVAVGTLGKALGLFGAFILLPKGWTEYLCNLASPLIYSTALPDAHAACVAMLPEQLAAMDEQRERVAATGKLMREELRLYGLPVHGSAHILAVEIGDEEKATAAAAALKNRGIFALAARHPTVPKRRAVIRFGITALHTARDAEVCVRALTTILRGMS